MHSLRTVQLWGVATKIATVLLGIAQTAIILRLLTPAEYGIVGIVISLGSLIGVSQHVGVVDATIREIAATNDPRRRASIFWVSLWFRLAVTVPLSLLLAVFATMLTNHFYPFPGMPFFLRLTSIILILQGIQGVVGGAYTGKLAFGKLYTTQVVMALLNVPLFALMTWWRGIGGFFEGVIISTGLFILLLSFSLRSALGGHLTHPSWQEIPEVLRAILHTGVWTYVARILSVAWQRVPLLLLARFASPEVVGLFNVALTFGSKLVILASAIGEVNLAFLSATFARSVDAFRDLARKTLEEVAVVLVFGAGGLAVFADVLLRFLAGPVYTSATTVTIFVTWAYAGFSFLDIATNTLFVPARRAHARAMAFASLTGVTIVVMWFTKTTPLLSGGIGALLGVIVALVVAHISARQMSASLLSPLILRTLPLLCVLVLLSSIPLPLLVRVIIFALISFLMARKVLPFLRSHLHTLEHNAA